jgi:hypothetical protein
MRHKCRSARVVSLLFTHTDAFFGLHSARAVDSSVATSRSIRIKALLVDTTQLRHDYFQSHRDVAMEPAGVTVACLCLNPCVA